MLYSTSKYAVAVENFSVHPAWAKALAMFINCR